MGTENDSNNAAGGTYSAADIEVLEGFEAVRKRPGMYFGSTGATGQTAFFSEFVDNVLDEHLGGHCSTLRVDYHPGDNSWTVSDDGRGLALESSPSALHRIFVQLHGGSTLDGHTPHVHSGLWGIGLAAANAVAELLVVTVSRPTGRYEAIFRAGQIVAPLTRVGDCIQSGTTIHVRPDMAIFTELPDLVAVEAHLDLVAHLNPRLRVEFCGRNISQPGGLLSLARSEAQGQIVDMLTVTARAEEIDVDIAIVWDGQTSFSRTFANQLELSEGGVVNDTIEEVMSYGSPAIVVVALMIQEPHYSGRTKQRLEMPKAGEATRSVLLPALRRHSA